jgi:hypothetical protein
MFRKLGWCMLMWFDSDSVALHSAFLVWMRLASIFPLDFQKQWSEGKLIVSKIEIVLFHIFTCGRKFFEINIGIVIECFCLLFCKVFASTSWSCEDSTEFRKILRDINYSNLEMCICISPSLLQLAWNPDFVAAVGCNSRNKDSFDRSIPLFERRFMY